MPTGPSKPYDKPAVPLVGTDGNIFVVVGTACRALRRAGHADMAKELQERVFRSSNYDEALGLVQLYVDAY